MITDSFDNKTDAKINPNFRENRIKCDVCIIIFSNIIEEYILKEFDCKKIGEIVCVTGVTPIYLLNYENKKIAFYKTNVGAPASVVKLEKATESIDVNKIVMFGGSGCLDKEIVHGKVVVPTYAYRDEGTSYHYAKAEDYIKIKNSSKVANFMKEKEIPYIEGKTWTTDAFFRETEDNIKKRREEGCISAEMECSAMQAVCNFRNKELYYFLTSGDLLDAPKWDKRHAEGEYHGTQHDITHFDIALELAAYIISNYKGE